MSQVNMIRTAAEWWSAALIDDRSDPRIKQKFSQQLQDVLRRKTASDDGAVFVLGAGEVLHPMLDTAMAGIEPIDRTTHPPEDRLLMFLDFREEVLTVQSGYRGNIRKLDLLA